ncbi:MAG TPA: AAA family ATPase, partial [Desulfobacter postgatei]|nr:AAA family ATPase [Desulfobacter postgatei]
MHEYEEVIIRVRFFMQLLLKDIRIVGFFRPIIDPTPKGTRDHDIDLVLSNFNIGLQYEETYAYTLEEAKQMLNSGRQTEMMETILNKFKALEEKSSFVLCEGTDFAAGSEAFEFDINAGIIADLGCPALVISNGYEKDAEQVITSCQLAVESLCQKGVDLLTGMDTYTAIKAVDQIYGRISPDDPQRIALALGFFEANVDAGSLRQRLAAR